jgi:hypothetical protein
MSLELALRSHDAEAGAGALPPPCAYTNGLLGAAGMQAGGVLDIATTPQLTMDAPTARLVMPDMPELAVVDSGGIHAIVGARQAGRRLAFVRLPVSSHFQDWGSPRTTDLSMNRHDPVDRGARRGSTT